MNYTYEEFRDRALKALECAKNNESARRNLSVDRVENEDTELLRKTTYYQNKAQVYATLAQAVVVADIMLGIRDGMVGR